MFHMCQGQRLSISRALQDHCFYSIMENVIPSNHILCVHSHFCCYLLFIFEDSVSWLCFPLQTKSWQQPPCLRRSFKQASSRGWPGADEALLFFLNFSITMTQESFTKNQSQICQPNQDKFWIFYLSFKNWKVHSTFYYERGRLSLKLYVQWSLIWGLSDPSSKTLLRSS